MRSAERAGKSAVFYAAVPLNLCRTLRGGGGDGMAQTRNAAEPLSFISLIPLWLSPVNRRGSLRTREIEKDESAPPPPKKQGGHVTFSRDTLRRASTRSHATTPRRGR